MCWTRGLTSTAAPRWRRFPVPREGQKESLDDHGPCDLCIRVGRAGLRVCRRYGCLMALALIEHAKAEMRRTGFANSGAMLAIVERFYDTWGAGEQAVEAQRVLALLLAGQPISGVGEAR